MIMEFGQYKVDIDVTKTNQFYENAKLVSENCSCDGCLNFESAAAALPQGVTEFFSNLGIDMKKAGECYVHWTNEDGTLFYGGFYHVCGTLLKGTSAWENNYWKKELSFAITPDFLISFQKDITLPEADFPLPAIELDIFANIPWVLNIENSYPKVKRSENPYNTI